GSRLAADADARPARCRAVRCRVRSVQLRARLPGRRSSNAIRRASNLQPFDDPTVHDVRVDDFVDVVAVDVGVPDLFRIDDDDGPLLTTIEAARLVDAHHPLAVEAELLDPLLGIRLHFGRAARGAACLGRVALVAAEKDMVFVIAHVKRRSEPQIIRERRDLPSWYAPIRAARRARADKRLPGSARRSG